MIERCYILKTDIQTHKDKQGCIKPSGHNDAHIFKDQNGDYIEWEDDYSCNCGCWDKFEEFGGQPCGVYKKLDNFDPSTNPTEEATTSREDTQKGYREPMS